MTTLAELRERHKKMIEDQGSQGNTGGGKPNNWHKLSLGDNWVRFLPGKNNPLEFFVEGHVHKYQDSDGKWHSYNCRKPHGEKCPFCDLYFDLWKMHKDLNLGKDSSGKNIQSKFGNLATAIKAKPRYTAVAVIRELQEKGEYPVKFVTMSQQLFDRVMAFMVKEGFYDDDDPDNTTIVSLEKGNDFNIRITTQGSWQSFVESEAKYKKTKAGNPVEMAEWMEHQLDLNSLVQIGDYEDGKKAAEMLLASLNTVKTENVSTSSSKGSNDDDDDGEDRFNKELKA